MLLEKLNLFSKSIEMKMVDICDRFDLTMMDIYVLMFLENSEDKDIASKTIIESGANKEEVNHSITKLANRGYIRAWYPNGEPDNIKLKICSSASYITSLINEAREDYLKVVLKGFDDNEKEALSSYIKRIIINIYDNTKKK